MRLRDGEAHPEADASTSGGCAVPGCRTTHARDARGDGDGDGLGGCFWSEKMKQAFGIQVCKPCERDLQLITKVRKGGKDWEWMKIRRGSTACDAMRCDAMLGCSDF